MNVGGRQLGPWVGLGLACALSLGLGLWNLEGFPPYFFCDEAAPANWAHHLLTHGFRGPREQLLPTFCPTGNRYTVGTTLYLQLPFVALWGKSLVLVRALTVLVTTVAAAGLAWALGTSLRLGTWWALPLLLLVNPAWFLHARTGYDNPIAAGFFGLFLGCGARFLCGSGNALYLSLVFAAASFYTSASARAVVPLAVLGLLGVAYCSRRQTPWKPVAFILFLFALPYVRYVVTDPGEQVSQLSILGSFWTEDRPLLSRLLAAGESYLAAWSPRFWLGTGPGPVRHKVPGMGLLHPLVVLLAGLGLLVALWRSRRGSLAPAYRFVLLCLVAAPAAALVFEPGVSRQFFLVPVLAMLAVVGSSALAEGLFRRWPEAFHVVFGAGLSVLALAVGVRSVTVGLPLQANYGFYGWQWGAPQVFETVRELLKKDPTLTVMFSLTSFNDSDQLGRFFLGDESRIQWISHDWLTRSLRPLPGNCIFVFREEEFTQFRTDPRFSRPRLVTVLYDPGGRPAFFFFRVSYSPEAREIIAREAEERRKPVRAVVTVLGEPVVVWHSLLDMGPLANAFDGSKATLIRTMEANPLRLDLEFPRAHAFQGATLRIGAGGTAVRVFASVANGWQLVGESAFPEAPATRDVEVPLRPVAAREYRVEIEDLEFKGQPSNVHLWELQLVEGGVHGQTPGTDRR